MFAAMTIAALIFFAGPLSVMCYDSVVNPNKRPGN